MLPRLKVRMLPALKVILNGSNNGLPFSGPPIPFGVLFGVLLGYGTCSSYLNARLRLYCWDQTTPIVGSDYPPLVSDDVGQLSQDDPLPLSISIVIQPPIAPQQTTLSNTNSTILHSFYSLDCYPFYGISLSNNNQYC